MKKVKYIAPSTEVIKLNIEYLLTPDSWGVAEDAEDNSHQIKDDTGIDPEAKGDIWSGGVGIWED
ncbi:MAG: hypothetical protein ACI3YX_01345 [Prevotella sp.]